MSRWPFASVVSAGRPANASVEPSFTWSFTPGTRFQNASTARTVRVNGLPAVCGSGVPSLPDGVPPCGDSPGRITCSPASAPGSTVKLLLDPTCGGAEKSEQVNDTAPPAPRNVIDPLHTPATNVTRSGVML